MHGVTDPLGAHALHPAELQTLVRALNTGSPLLIYRDSGDAVHVCQLTPGSSLTIGRKHEADIALPWDVQVSRLHAEVYELSGEWMVADDGLSSYGTFVNGNRVSSRHRLRHEDRLRVGRTTLVYLHQPSVRATEQLVETIGDELPQLTPMRRRVLVELCRPVLLDAAARPATNPEIADAVHLSAHAVKDHLGVLARVLGHASLERGQQRAMIADTAIRRGLVSIRDLS